MPESYAKHLRPTLASRLNNFLNSGTHQEQLQLYQEIALARTFLTQQLDILNGLHALKEQGDDRSNDGLIMMAMQGVRCATDHVAELCSKMSKIEKDLDDKVSVRQMGVFVETITRTIYKHLGDDPRVTEIAEDMRSMKLLPNEIDPDVDIKIFYEDDKG